MSKIQENSWLGRSLSSQRRSEWKPVRIVCTEIQDLCDDAHKFIVFTEEVPKGDRLIPFVFILPQSGLASDRLSAFTRACGIAGNPQDTLDYEGRYLSVRGRGDLPSDFAPLQLDLKSAA